MIDDDIEKTIGVTLPEKKEVADLGVILLPCVAVGPKTLLKLKTLRPSFPSFDGSDTTSEPSSPTKSITFLASVLKDGLILQ